MFGNRAEEKNPILFLFSWIIGSAIPKSVRSGDRQGFGNLAPLAKHSPYPPLDTQPLEVQSLLSRQLREIRAVRQIEQTGGKNNNNKKLLLILIRLGINS